jgi:hypothetical protein
MNIDCSDAQYELKIGDSVRRSLIRHFHAFIIKQIKTRGFDADDPRLFNQDVLDAEAWRLAATVMGLRLAYWCHRRRLSISKSICPAACLRSKMII